MNWKVESKIEGAVERIKQLDEGDGVQFIILFGSSVAGDRNVMSDIDLAIGYRGNKKERFNFRITASGELPRHFDIHIFQDLPLYLRKEVLQGEVLYVRDFKELHDIAMETIRDYDFFEPRLLDYIQR